MASAMQHKGSDSNKLQSVRALAIQTGVLIHEVDEGSPCLTCGDKCKNGFSLHYWRKVCANCHCPREDHDIRPHAERQAAVGKLLFHSDAATMLKDASRSPRRPRAPVAKHIEPAVESPSILRKTENYTWTPRDITIEAARAYFEGLPVNKTPIAGTPGDRYWQKQKIRQLPAHDIDLIYCNELTDEECKQMEMFIKIRREKFLGRGMIKLRQNGDKLSTKACKQCKSLFKVGEAVVTAGKLPDNYWHPSCFMCFDCGELLIELIYFVHDGEIYCGRDHAEKLKPRCAACDEIIFCTEYTRAEDQNWHVNHFCCHRCDSYLGGQNYIAKKGQPYCLNCYEIKYANICEACGSTIPLDEPLLKHNDKYWHAKDECFKCYMCKKPLVDQPFLPKLNQVFCSKECLREYKDSRKGQ